MGLTSVTLEVANIVDPASTVEVDCLVDSGAIYSVIPRTILEDLGIKPLLTQRFSLANGEQMTRDKGGALFKFQDRIGVSDVVFGEEGDETLLGAFTLEALGLALDPLRRELKPIPMML